ncbi:MAG: FG-GAP repeat domain-containing protein [Acidobacteriota bacterium]
MRYALLLLTCWLMPATELRFRQHTIAADLEGGYQVVAADLNKDGRPDLIALASGMDELIWFENPGWRRHVIARGRSQMINLAAADLDGDGIPEIVLAEGFAMDPRKSGGVISLLKHQGDPRGLWSVTEIDRLPASHRLRWADPDGSGKKVLMNAPLAGAGAVPPGYRARVPLVLYRPGAWKREVISDELEGVLHGIRVTDWDGDGRDEILTASFGGIAVFKLAKDGRWQKTGLAQGDPAPWPKCGASDVDTGRLGEKKFFCSIEPWHGNQVAVYFNEGGAWKRNVIEDKLVDGHALLAADLDRDGRDEIIAGFRGKGGSVWIYRAEDAGGNRWTRTALDEGGMAAASCALAGSNLACIDNHRLKWYEGAPWGPLIGVHLRSSAARNAFSAADERR